ncbi:hypothetical protein HPB47_007448, partial [Ixodes persulcatus]
RNQGNANFHISCRLCRRRPQATVTAWTVQTDGGPVGWASRHVWEEQPRPERSEVHVIVPEQFRGLTLEDRHPNEPAAQCTADEWRLLCPLCRVPELPRETHQAGLLLVSREAADRAARRQNHDQLQMAIGAAAFPQTMQSLNLFFFVVRILARHRMWRPVFWLTSCLRCPVIALLLSAANQ